MRKMKCSSLVQDMSVYPRTSVDWSHVEMIEQALEAGAELPPLVICRKSRRVVDGMHRLNALIRQYGNDHPVDVLEKNYGSDRELFLDSIRFNAKHGAPLTRSDRRHCALVCDQVGATSRDLAGALCVSQEVACSLRPQVVSRPTLESSATYRPVPSHAPLARVDFKHNPDGTPKKFLDRRELEQAIIEAAMHWYGCPADEMESAHDRLHAAVQAFVQWRERVAV
jgi:hypothetical protein